MTSCLVVYDFLSCSTRLPVLFYTTSCLVSHDFLSGPTRCPPAWAGTRWPSGPGGRPVRLWAGRSSSDRRTSRTSGSGTCCDGSPRTSPGSSTRHSEFAEGRTFELISYDVISYEVISDEVISYEVISDELISYDVISYDVISDEVISDEVIS